MSTGPWLGAQGLACGHRRPVLVDVDLAVHGGEAWFVLGPNGAGKSTLVATLLGLLRPLAGRVLPPCGGDRRRLGFVPQEPRTGAPLPVTVAEWCRSALADQAPRQAAAARTAAALQRLDIAGLATADLRTLSLGQRRRVHVARALVRQPQLLVLDEPGANLDPAATWRLAEDLDRLRRDEGLALLQVGHELATARRFATHVAYAAGGRVLAGPAARVLADPAVSRALGDPTP